MADQNPGSTSNPEDLGGARQTFNPLPRAIVRPNSYELLDGQWRFELDLGDAGMSEKWYLGHRYSQTATWPGSIESHMAAGRDERQQARAWQDNVVAWYEREFVIPQPWRDQSDHLTQVTFGACGYETRVWLNGHLLRTIEGEEVNFGEYTSFSYELPPEYLLPANRLTVRVADSLDAEIPRGKQESHVYKRGGIWYQTYTGAVRSVWLEPVERNRLRSRLNIISNIRDRIVGFDFTTRIHDPGLYRLRLTVTPRGASHPSAEAEFHLGLEAGEKRQRVSLEMPGAELWSPAQPNLYRLAAQLTNSRVDSQISANFGLRRIEARGRSIYLNHEPIYLDGILYQPGTATYAEMQRHMLAMKRLGCNLVRVHIAGIDPRVYALADEIGMLLWVEAPSPHVSSPRSRANHWAEVRRMLVHTGAHPSVIIWSLYNEDWGAQDIATNAETRRYIVDAYNHLRLNHPQFLVVDNDGWNHVSLEGRLQSDLLTAHIYTPEIERWRELLDKLSAGEMREITAHPLVIGDPFFYCGQAPLVVSEWGGFGFSHYGGPEESAKKAEAIRSFKRELRQRRIAGDVYTQATSIEEENNGVIDARTGELFVPGRLLDSTALE